MSQIVGFTLNGRNTEVLAEPLVTLQTVLRKQLGYTGTKDGCGQGSCGSCTVLVDGDPVLSCITPVEAIAGKKIMTIEGVSEVEKLHALQQSFVENYASQCGYCTPGFILVAYALLEKNPSPTREDVITALSGNHCRCTGYKPILAAVEKMAAKEGI